jgi:hypothetical protein
MTAWTKDELTRIENTEEVQVASRRRDDTLRKPVTVWVVPYGDSLYVRSVGGPGAAWFRGTQERHEGRIRAGGVEKDVTFTDAVHDLDDEIDAAYRTKYRRYAGRILNSVLTPQARSATIKLVPRTTPPASAT